MLERFVCLFLEITRAERLSWPLRIFLSFLVLLILCVAVLGFVGLGELIGGAWVHFTKH